MDEDRSYESNEEHRDLPKGKAGEEQNPENDDCHHEDDRLHFLRYRFSLLIPHSGGNIDVIAVEDLFHIIK